MLFPFEVQHKGIRISFPRRWFWQN